MIKKKLLLTLTVSLIFSIGLPLSSEAKMTVPHSKQPTTKKVNYNFKTKKVTVKGKAGKSARVMIVYRNKRIVKKASNKTGNYRISIKIKKSDVLRIYAKEQGHLDSKVKKIKANRYLTKSPNKIIAGGPVDDNKVTKVLIRGKAPKHSKVNIRFKGKLVKQVWTKKNSERYQVYVKVHQTDLEKYSFQASAKKKNKKRSKLVTLSFPTM